MVELLKQILWSYIVLTYKYQNIHRNITWPIFIGWHTKLQKHYEYAFEAQDDVAEQLRQLWEVIDTMPWELCKNSVIKHLDKMPDLQTTVQIVVDDHNSMASLIKTAMLKADADKEYWVLDMLTKLYRWHNKQRWLVESIIK